MIYIWTFLPMLSGMFSEEKMKVLSRNLNRFGFFSESVLFHVCVFFSVGQIDGHKLDADLCRVIGIPNNLHVSTVFEEIQTIFGIF